MKRLILPLLMLPLPAAAQEAEDAPPVPPALSACTALGELVDYDTVPEGDAIEIEELREAAASGEEDTCLATLTLMQLDQGFADPDCAALLGYIQEAGLPEPEASAGVMRMALSAEDPAACAAALGRLTGDEAG
ncbi:hypothetical protein [Pseudoroseicyclus aestuarii]|uniref:Sel1 repeat-containing protein n=1 Tax=Pseudoroseicyclus aestuarii TaxID=1795041 RepID=A0A318SWZ9_9RHOB|nr:hypothetical protein [Pseudoroseicyclus aestuarii]PYE85855.1 hypothetical protein DFP88_101528 [Pseudoroseicyclus aestuarii]